MTTANNSTGYPQSNRPEEGLFPERGGPGQGRYNGPLQDVHCNPLTYNPVNDPRTMRDLAGKDIPKDFAKPVEPLKKMDELQMRSMEITTIAFGWLFREPWADEVIDELFSFKLGNNYSPQFAEKQGQTTAIVLMAAAKIVYQRRRYVHPLPETIGNPDQIHGRYAIDPHQIAESTRLAFPAVNEALWELTNMGILGVSRLESGGQEKYAATYTFQFEGDVFPAYGETRIK